MMQQKIILCQRALWLDGRNTLYCMKRNGMKRIIHQWQLLEPHHPLQARGPPSQSRIKVIYACIIALEDPDQVPNQGTRLLHSYLIEVDCSLGQFKVAKLKDKEYDLNAPIFSQHWEKRKKMDPPNFYLFQADGQLLIYLSQFYRLFSLKLFNAPGIRSKYCANIFC